MDDKSFSLNSTNSIMNDMGSDFEAPIRDHVETTVTVATKRRKSLDIFVHRFPIIGPSKGSQHKQLTKQLMELLDRPLINFQSEKEKFDNQAFRRILTDRPALIKQKYLFKCHEKKLFPIVIASFLASQDIVRYMNEIYPEVSLLCPLSALLTGANLDTFQKAVKDHPDDATAFFADRSFLHLVLIFYGEVEIIKFLLNTIHPKHLVKKCPLGNTPFALACLNRDDLEEVAKLLVDKNPNTVEVCDTNGMNPLHLLCQKGDVSLELIKYLIRKRPGALTKCDNNGDSPLHIACSKNESPEIIKFLAERDPDMLITKNVKGDIPYILVRNNQIISSDIDLSIQKATFYKIMFEADNGDVIATIDSLVPLIFNVSALAIFYNFVSAKYSLHQISKNQQNCYIHDGLNVAVKTLNTDRARKRYDFFLKKALKGGIVTEASMRSIVRSNRKNLLRRIDSSTV